MLSINTNLSSLIAQKSLSTSTNKLNQAIERMSTGCKINHACDNAANYSISTNMTTRIGAYEVAENNTAMGLDMITTASESLSQIETALNRLRTLAIQSSNGTYGAQSQNAINSEANALVDEIERIYRTVEYNGINLAKGKVVSQEQGKFIKDIDRRDTSSMTKLKDVNENETLTSGTYSISTADELEKLARMTNNGKIGANTEFVLANDIDLGHIANWTPIGSYIKDANNQLKHELTFRACFDGNGFTITGMNIDTTENFKGLFGFVFNSVISNVAIENTNILDTGQYAGALVGDVQHSEIANCYFSGNIQSSNSYVGGLIGYAISTNIEDCYSEGSVTSSKNYIGGLIGATDHHTVIRKSYSKSNVSGLAVVGGLIGATNNFASLYNCYTTGDVNANSSLGGLIGRIGFNMNINNRDDVAIIKDCYATGQVSGGANKGFIGAVLSQSDLLVNLSIKNCYFTETLIGNNKINNKYYTYEDENNNLIDVNTNLYVINNNASFNNYNAELSLQIGINNAEYSSISCILDNSLTSRLKSLKNLGVPVSTTSIDYIDYIDSIRSRISLVQIEYGSVQNRLTSVLDEIQIQKENLVSSRSTLRDADMAEVSSTYIQQQILQQASATLMSTANQAPSIALRLLQGF